MRAKWSIYGFRIFDQEEWKAERKFSKSGSVHQTEKRNYAEKLIIVIYLLVVTFAVFIVKIFFCNFTIMSN